MNKPEMKTQPPAYIWREIEEYIEKKYNLDLRDLVRGDDDERRDFWHYLCEVSSIHRGCYINVSTEMLIHEQWQKDVIDTLVAEFGDHIRIWVDW